MAKITKVKTSRFPKAPPRGRGKAGPKPTGAKPDRSFQVGMSRNPGKGPSR